MCKFTLLLSSVCWGQVLSRVHKGHRCWLVPQPSVGLRSVYVNKCPAFPGSPGFSAGISSVHILATTWIDLPMLLRACHVVEAFKEGGHWLLWCGVIPSNCDFKKNGWVAWANSMNWKWVWRWALRSAHAAEYLSVVSSETVCLLLPQRLCMGRSSLYHPQRRDSPLYQRFSDDEKKSLVVLLKITVITVMIRPATSCKCLCCAKQFVNVI